MTRPTLARTSGRRFFCAVAAALAVLQCRCPRRHSRSKSPWKRCSTASRSRIYWCGTTTIFRMGKAHEMSEYFTEDAMLDVDGTIANGRAAIEKLYGGGPARDANVGPRPHNHMLLTNPVIEVKGNRAQAHVIWTGVSNKGVGEPPSLYEQGREDTELVKVNGKWLISKRYISSDSGLPDRFDQTFKQRDNPLAPL